MEVIKVRRAIPLGALSYSFPDPADHTWLAKNIKRHTSRIGRQSIVTDAILHSGAASACFTITSTNSMMPLMLTHALFVQPFSLFIFVHPPQPDLTVHRTSSPAAIMLLSSPGPEPEPILELKPKLKPKPKPKPKPESEPEIPPPHFWKLGLTWHPAHVRVRSPMTRPPPH
ncbi:hypothetical protein RSAG8_13473, partial [Rhizoctonia solani AG-8 WAC10335]